MTIIAGCTQMNIEDYAGTEPEFRLEDYFLGHVQAWGQFQDRGGEVKRRFFVDIHGHMEGDTLVLDEDFRYADGETGERVWRIRATGENTYEGTAGDVRGMATGRRAGHVFNWQYTLELPYGDGTVAVNFDDWMYLQEGGVLINRATMKKFGIRLGELTIFFQKVTDT